MLPKLRALTLVLTHSCNLRCSYCYVDTRAPLRMSVDVLRQSLDWFEAGSCADSTLAFFGGEPLLEPDSIHTGMNRLSRPGQRFVVATNGTLLSELGPSLSRPDLELSIGIDGVLGNSQRRRLDGTDPTQSLLATLRRILPDHRGLAKASLTVTPANVHLLLDSLQALRDIGFRRFSYHPGLDLVWNARAVERWGAEHHRIGAWLTRLRSSGQAVPLLSRWEATRNRLTKNAPRKPCGAGVELFAAGSDGALYPCHRFACDPRLAGFAVGDVWRGLTNAPLLEQFAALDLDSLEPEDRPGTTCRACEAADGCTYDCPAHAILGTGRMQGVPALACELERARVRAVREWMSQTRRPGAGTAWIAAAAMTAAVGCGGQVVSSPPSGPADASVEADAKQDSDATILIEDTGPASDSCPDWCWYVEDDSGPHCYCIGK